MFNYAFFLKSLFQTKYVPWIPDECAALHMCFFVSLFYKYLVLLSTYYIEKHSIQVFCQEPILGNNLFKTNLAGQYGNGNVLVLQHSKNLGAELNSLRMYVFSSLSDVLPRQIKDGKPDYIIFQNVILFSGLSRFVKDVKCRRFSVTDKSMENRQNIALKTQKRTA